MLFLYVPCDKPYIGWITADLILDRPVSGLRQLVKQVVIGS